MEGAQCVLCGQTYGRVVRVGRIPSEQVSAHGGGQRPSSTGSVRPPLHLRGKKEDQRMLWTTCALQSGACSRACMGKRPSSQVCSGAITSLPGSKRGTTRPGYCPCAPTPHRTATPNLSCACPCVRHIAAIPLESHRTRRSASHLAAAAACTHAKGLGNHQ